MSGSSIGDQEGVHPKWNKSAFTPGPQNVTSLWPVLISCPTEGRRLSWPGWIGVILRWFIRPKTVTHPAAVGNRTRDHWAASPTP